MKQSAEATNFGIDDWDAKQWHDNFIAMAVIFATCEAAASIPLGFATAVLDQRVGQIGTGIVFILMMISSVFLGPSLVKRLGVKASLIIGMALETSFTWLFVLASLQQKGSSSQWIVYICGAIASGAGSGIAWTAQGAFFAYTCNLISESCADVDEAQCEETDSESDHGVDQNRSSLLTPLLTSNEGVQPKRSEVRQTTAMTSPATPLDRSESRKEIVAALFSQQNRGKTFGGQASSNQSFGNVRQRMVCMRQQVYTPYGAPSEDPAMDADATAALAGKFAFLLLSTDVLVKFSSSILQGCLLQWHFHAPFLDIQHTFLLFASVASIALLAMLRLREPRQAEETVNAERNSGKRKSSFRDAFALWKHSKVWCLGFTNVTFGICAGYMNGIVNGSFVVPNSTLGTSSLGTLLALTSLVAASCSVLFSLLAQRAGSGVVLGLGSLAFACIPISILLMRPEEANDYWGVSLAFLFVLQGIGRSVFEGTNRAIFADFFPGEESAGAFAACLMQSGFSFFTSFLMQGVLPVATRDTVIPWMVLGLASCMLPGYVLANRRHEL